MSEIASSVPTWSAVMLLSVISLKHYGADFVLQTNWMARGKEQVRGWLTPLAAHVACHAGLTLLIALIFRPQLWWLALVDLAIHIVIDRAKSLISLHSHWQPKQVQFWWLLGFDQFLHQLTNIGLAFALLLL